MLLQTAAAYSALCVWQRQLGLAQGAPPSHR